MDSSPAPSPPLWPHADAASRSVAPVRETAHPAFLVATNATLFRHIVSFQAGMPVELRQFWIRHDARRMRGPISSEHIAQLTRLVVQFGSLDQLELIQASRFFWRKRWCAPELQDLAQLAIASDRADILQWMLMKGRALPSPHELWRSAVRKGPKTGNFAVLEFLRRVLPLKGMEDKLDMFHSLSNPTVPLLRWISTHYPNVPFPTELVTSAVEERDLDVLGYLLGHKPSQGCIPTAFDSAYESNHHEVLEYLIADWARSMAKDVAHKIVLDENPRIQEIVQKYPAAFAPAFREVFLQYACAGNCDAMEELCAKSVIDTAEPFSIDDAASWKGLAGLEFLHERGMARATTESMDAAAEAKRWDVVEFLHINRTEGCTTRAADAAVKSVNINCVRFFLTNRSEGCSPAAMDHAAAHGSVDILRYLHQYSKTGCTTDAMDGAASRGHLQVVKFLHENRSEGCTTAAIDGASRGGFLEVVQYLCRHRNEGCTKAAVQGALQNYHLEVFELLYEHYPHLFGAEMLFDVLLRGAFDVFMKLRDDFPEEARSVVESVMFEAGKQFELRTIRFIIDELGRSDLQGLVMDGAHALEDADNSEWRDALGLITTDPVQTTSLEDSPLHPLLQHTQTPSWAVRIIFNNSHIDFDSYNRCSVPLTWAVRAIYHRDLNMLQIIHDLPRGTTEPYRANPFLGGHGTTRRTLLQLEGARAAAIRVGDKKILEWLLTNVDLPVEKTLLDEAVYYHQYEIAEWLLVNHPEACTELDWTNKGNETTFHNFGLQDGLLDWLEGHDAVREALPFSGVVDFAARKNDVESLTRLYAWYPELFTPRASLVALADLEECSDTINFLLEIGWSEDVFF